MGLVLIYLSFKRKIVELKKKNKQFIDVNRYPLNVTSNCFLKGVKVLTAGADSAFDQIVIDLFGFFTYVQNVLKTTSIRKALLIYKLNEFQNTFQQVG